MTRLRLHILWLLALAAPLVTAPRDAAIPAAPPARPVLQASAACFRPTADAPSRLDASARVRRTTAPGRTEVPHLPWTSPRAPQIWASACPGVPSGRLPAGPAPLQAYVTTLPPPDPS